LDYIHGQNGTIARKILIHKGCVARILRFHHTLQKADTTNGRN
jgi:hypothetical protein